MALDKVVDSAVLDAGMKSVADAIRAKAGTTDPLAWPDGFKAAVEGIQTGGGGEQSLGYATGTFIPESNTTNVVITHNLGRIPSFIFVYYTGTYSSISTFPNRVISDLFATIGKQLMVRTYDKKYMIREYNITNFEGSDNPIQNANETTVRLYDCIQDDFYAQGFEYKWIMW